MNPNLSLLCAVVTDISERSFTETSELASESQFSLHWKMAPVKPTNFLYLMPARMLASQFSLSTPGHTVCFLYVLQFGELEFVWEKPLEKMTDAMVHER